MANGMNSVLRPAFVTFDEQRTVRIYQRNLPHWRQRGCTYFVTFRLGDSIPDGVRRQWEDEQRQWLQARGIRYDGPQGAWRAAFERLPANERWQFQKHFNRQVESCLDRGLGECWLRRKDCIDIVRTKLLSSDGVAYHLGDFVIMPNHVHLLVTPAVERNLFRSTELEMLLKRIKGSSAVECNRAVNRSGTFWQADSYDHIVRSLEQLHAFRAYIAANPQQAGITLPASALYRAAWVDKWFCP